MENERGNCFKEISAEKHIGSSFPEACLSEVGVGVPLAKVPKLHRRSLQQNSARTCLNLPPPPRVCHHPSVMPRASEEVMNNQIQPVFPQGRPMAGLEVHLGPQRRQTFGGASISNALTKLVRFSGLARIAANHCAIALVCYRTPYPIHPT